MSRPYIPEHIDIRVDRIVSKLPGMNRNTLMILLLDSTLTEINEEEFIKRFRQSIALTKKKT